MDSEKIFERIEKSVEQTYSSFPSPLKEKKFTFIRRELMNDADIVKIVDECCKKDIDNSSVNVVLAYKMLPTNSINYVDVLINSVDFKVLLAMHATFFIQGFKEKFSDCSPMISFNPYLTIENCLPIRITFN
ncbi:MAG: hypothetical protein E7310_06600 [Clostridiales bacterium]|nr:hypothetical protein [Clostridiales bacterium]